MTKVSTDHFRDLLLAERKRVQHALDVLHQENSMSVDDELGEVGSNSIDDHPGDVATETHDRELDYGLEENAEAVMQEIDAALKRVEDGTYGKCEICGRDIDEARLEARPWATLCIDDQRRLEQR
jgi:RNA polymerase-binding protein DksA